MCLFYNLSIFNPVGRVSASSNYGSKSDFHQMAPASRTIYQWVNSTLIEKIIRSHEIGLNIRITVDKYFIHL